MVRLDETVPGFLKDDRALNRHRLAYEERRDGFFPTVHMAPFEDGSLLVAAWYYVWRVHEEASAEPRELLESIAAAKLCKFSIMGTRNRDYAGDLRKLAASLPYIQADLEVLRPGTLILPRAIWTHRTIRDTVLAAVPAAEALPLPQFNPRVVHIHLRKHAESTETLEGELRGTALPSWIARMKGYAEGAPYRFLVEMDEVMAEHTPPSSAPP